MEFHQKLQQLRKAKGLTQEQLAEKLYVSRTAVSKWESGRGYPNIESLKDIAAFFSVSIDALLSSDEVVTIAEEDSLQRQHRFRCHVWGLLDCSAALLLFLPLFGQRTGALVQGVSLLALTDVSPALRPVYFAMVLAIVAMGILTLALQNSTAPRWLRLQTMASLGLNGAAALLFILALHPYAASLLLAFLAIKVFSQRKAP